MKKSVLLFASLLLAAVSAIAQPAKPTVTYSDWASVEEKADIYLYNVEAGMFLSAGSAWGTRATLIGTKDKSTYNDLIMGAGEFKGNKWFIAVAQDQRDGKACYMFQNKSGTNYLTADNKDGIWVDGDAGRPYDGWYIAKDNGDKTFQLGYMLRTEKKDDAGNVIKEDDKTVYDYSSMGIFGVQKFDEGNLDTYLDESTAYSTWAIVSTAEYEEKLPAFKLYYIAKGLEKLVADAKELGIEADFSSYEALLVKEGVTYDEIKTAIDKFSPTVNFGKVIADAKKADPARDWSKYEAIYADPASTNEIFTANTNLINAFLALKKALDEGKALDAAHSYKTAEDLYASDESKQADIEAETARVNAFASLKKKLDEATEGYPAVDFGEAKAVYDNIASTAAQCAEAEKKIDALKADYDIKNATVDKPGDITSLLTNVDGKSITDWTRTFTGEGTVGDFACNTWSVEANNGADGTNMVVNFLQVWQGKGSILSDQKFQRNTVKVAPGAYKITGNIRIYNESGAEYMKGAYIFANINQNSLFANEDEAQTNALEGAKYNTYNNMLNYWKDGFETYTIVPADSTLTFGVKVEGANYNWIAAKDFHVYYLGDSYESLDYVRNNSEMVAQPFPEGTIAMKQLLDEYNNAIPNYGKAKTQAEFSEAVNALFSLADSVQANVNAYKAYIDKVEELKKGIEEGTIELIGDDADILFDYLDDMGEELGPDSEAAIDLGFSNGYSAYILANCLLKTEEIKAELEFLNKLYDTAMRTSIKDGSDLTDLLVNPDFSTNDWTGWTKEAASGGNVAVGDKCAEAWNNSAFDIYQEQEGLPDGLYEISVQGFYRYKRGNPAFQAYKEQSNDYVKEGGSPCYVYMNTMTTPFTNVFGEENKGQEFYGSTNYDTYTYGDGDDAITEYYPNGMSSAAVAFEAGMYTQTAYGLVLNGEKMRVGVKGSSNQEGDSWVIFDNFKLTYRAKNPEVAQKVLEIKAEALKELIEKSGDAMTDKALDDARYALSEAQKTDLNDAAKYEVLIETNDAYNAAKENAEKVEAYKAAEKAYYDACTELEKIDTNGEAAIWDEVDKMDKEIAGEAYKELGNEEIDQLTADVDAMTEKVKEAIKEIQVAAATDDEPADFTLFIVNPDFETGNLNGWTNSGSIGAQSQNNDSFDNKQGTYYAERWHVNGTIDINQTIAKLPAGVYELTAYVYSSAEDAILYAHNSSVSVTTSGLYSVVVELTEPTDFKFGVSWSDTGDKWTCLDDFKLTCYGTESSKEISPTDINEIDAQPVNKKNGKFFENGQLVIYKDGKKYNAVGVLLQ